MAQGGPQPMSREEGSKLFVGGLSAQTTTEVLRAHFLKYGHLIDAVVMQRNGRPRGFGFVMYDTSAGAIAALSEPQWLDGRYVDVKLAVPGEPLTPPSSGRSPSERAGGCANKLFVGGLPQDATCEDLKVAFGIYGPVADAVVMVDRRTNRSRGFGFVRFGGGQVAGAAAAEAALADFPSHRLGGKWVEVKRATPAAVLQELSTCSQMGAVAELCNNMTAAVLEQQAYYDSFDYLSCWEGQQASMGLGFDNSVASSPGARGHARGRRGRRRRQWSGYADAAEPDVDFENNPAMANMKTLACPPGLLPEGIDLPPMKVACRSATYDNLVHEDHLEGFTREDFLSTEIRPWLSAW